MQHVEFFHKDHFEEYYHRVYTTGELSPFIEFFWETRFDKLWSRYPRGFSDALFPNYGYTYLVNLGTPFVMQVDDQKFDMRTDGFLPRHQAIECYHKPGNKLFGIKFKVSPVVFEKKVDFSEYQGYIFPLSYLIEQEVIDKVKSAAHFPQRVSILQEYFLPIIRKHKGSLRPVEIVTSILSYCDQENEFNMPVEKLAARYDVSTRTLQRYFETTTGISSKKALQILRIRKATAHLANDPATFHYSYYGYYDHSHFYKHLKQFLHKQTLLHLEPHLKLLETLHK